jgi:hypothetical protein
MPENVGKDQIRRVAVLYLRKFEAERDAFLKLLQQSAETIPKKPLFLRIVLFQALTDASEAKELIARVTQAKAVAVLGFTEGLPAAKQRELNTAFSKPGRMFRALAAADAGKKSVTIDIIVELMLLPPES